MPTFWLLASPKIVVSPRRTFNKTSIRVSHTGARLHHLRSGPGCPEMREDRSRIRATGSNVFLKWGSSALNRSATSHNRCGGINQKRRPNAEFKRLAALHLVCCRPRAAVASDELEDFVRRLSDYPALNCRGTASEDRIQLLPYYRRERDRLGSCGSGIDRKRMGCPIGRGTSRSRLPTPSHSSLPSRLDHPPAKPGATTRHKMSGSHGRGRTDLFAECVRTWFTGNNLARNLGCYERHR